MLTLVSRLLGGCEARNGERDWALASARAQGISIRRLAGEVGLSPTRVHRLLAAVDLDASIRR